MYDLGDDQLDEIASSTAMLPCSKLVLMSLGYMPGHVSNLYCVCNASSEYSNCYKIVCVLPSQYLLNTYRVF